MNFDHNPQDSAWTTPEWLATEAGVTPACARTWIRRHGLGKKVAGRFWVDRERARQFLKGVDFTAR